MILNEVKIADHIQFLLNQEKSPLFEHEIFEKLSFQKGFYMEDLNILSKILNSDRYGFGKIGRRFFILGDNYFSNFIPRFQYIQNSLKSTIGSQSSAFVPFLFFLGRAQHFLILGDLAASAYKGRHKDLNLFYNLTKDTLNDLRLEFPTISDFFSQMEILLGQLLTVESMHGLFMEILDVLKSLQLESISESEFSMVFEHIIQYSLESNKSDFALSDPFMSEVLHWFLSEEESIKVFDPYLGIGTFLTSLHQKVKRKYNSYYGVEINKEIYELSCLNFIANNLSIDNLSHGNSESISTKEEIDYVVSDLPWSNFLMTRINDGMKSSPIQHIQNALKKCRYGGKAFLFVSDSFLGSNIKNIREYRRHLVENGLVEGVIRFKTYSEKKSFNKNFANLIVLRNQPNKDIDYVKFFDFSTSDKPILSSHIKLFKENYSGDSDLLFLDRGILKRYDYDLYPSTYDKTIFETEQLIKEGKAEYLENLVKVRSGGIRILNLQNENSITVFNQKSFRDKFEEVFVGQEHLIQIDFNKNLRLMPLSEEAILISRVGKKFSPMIFRPTPKLPSIFLTMDVFVITPTSEQINLEYLYYQLYTPIVESQIFKRLNKSALFTLSLVNLKKVVIPMMSLPAQKEFVASQGLSIKSLEKKNEKEEIEERSIEEQKEATQDEVVRTFVHQIRAKIQTVDNNMFMVDQIAKKHSLLNFKLDADGSEQSDENPTLGEYLKLVLDQSYHLQKELEFIREVMKFNIHEDKIERRKIKKFFQNWAGDQNKGVGKKIKITISGQDPEIEFSPDAFRAIADQVYKNTIDHGFSESYTDVSIQIEILNQEKTVLIIIRNNGEPSEIDFEDFLQPFRKRNGSNGSGIGGNYISRIVKAHRGEITQIRRSEGFGFKIEIPKKQVL